MAIMERPPLFDHRIDVRERSKLKKKALWEEIKNILGGILLTHILFNKFSNTVITRNYGFNNNFLCHISQEYLRNKIKLCAYSTGTMSIDELQKKWKYHRDCYMRARKKMKTYVPSGSGALPSNLKNSYRYFELMKPLDDTLQAES